MDSFWCPFAPWCTLVAIEHQSVLYLVCCANGSCLLCFNVGKDVPNKTTIVFEVIWHFYSQIGWSASITMSCCASAVCHGAICTTASLKTRWQWCSSSSSPDRKPLTAGLARSRQRSRLIPNQVGVHFSPKLENFSSESWFYGVYHLALQYSTGVLPSATTVAEYLKLKGLLAEADKQALPECEVSKRLKGIVDDAENCLGTMQQMTAKKMRTRFALVHSSSVWHLLFNEPVNLLDCDDGWFWCIRFIQNDLTANIFVTPHH